MLPVATVLEIIRLILALTLEAVKDMPVEQKQAVLARHELRIQFFENLLPKQFKLEQQ